MHRGDNVRHGGFMGPQKVPLPARVLVPDLEAKLLNIFEIIVEDNLLHPFGAEAVADRLGSTDLIIGLGGVDGPGIALEDQAEGVGLGEEVGISKLPTGEGQLELGGAAGARVVVGSC